MTQIKPNPIFRLMPSLTDIAFLMPLLFLFTRMEGVKSLLGDGDTGWHIRTGEWILKNHQVPHTDIFSYTMPGQPWYAWEWLWDIAAAMLHARFGLTGVVLPSMFIICLTFALLYKVVNQRSGNPLVAIALTVLAAAGSTVHWLARPHLLTMLFTVIFLTILERVRKGKIKLLWLLPLLTVLWTNLHGGFVVGVVLLGAYGAGELARAVLAVSREERITAFRSALPYLAASAGCLAASLVNPYFYHLHVHIWQYLHDPYQLAHIVEFQGTNFQNGGMEFFEMMLVVAFGAAVWYGLRKQFSEVIVLAGFAHLGLMAERNVPIFMIIAAPMTAVAVVAGLDALRQAALPGWMQRLGELVKSAGEEIGPIDQLWRVHLVCAAGLMVVLLGMTVPEPGIKLKPVYDEKVYPAGALSVLRDPAQHIFTHDEWGDYLIYQLSPGGTKVYIDGRSDFYGGKFGQEFLDLMNVKYDWEQKLARYGVDTVLLPPDAPLATTIKESSHWRVVYDDGVAIVFRTVSASAREQQTSTSIIGGEKRDRRVTESWIAQPHVIFRNHDLHT